MTRQESDREDLIREAVAMPERGEFRVPGLDELVTVGFRTTAAMSVFIGQDPVYQFDPAGRLRRAFANGVRSGRAPELGVQRGLRLQELIEEASSSG